MTHTATPTGQQKPVNTGWFIDRCIENLKNDRQTLQSEAGVTIDSQQAAGYVMGFYSALKDQGVDVRPINFGEALNQVTEQLKNPAS